MLRNCSDQEHDGQVLLTDRGRKTLDHASGGHVERLRRELAGQFQRGRTCEKTPAQSLLSGKPRQGLDNKFQVHQMMPCCLHLEASGKKA